MTNWYVVVVLKRGGMVLYGPFTEGAADAVVKNYSGPRREVNENVDWVAKCQPMSHTV